MLACLLRTCWFPALRLQSRPPNRRGPATTACLAIVAMLVCFGVASAAGGTTRILFACGTRWCTGEPVLESELAKLASLASGDTIAVADAAHLLVMLRPPNARCIRWRPHDVCALVFRDIPRTAVSVPTGRLA